MDRYPIPLDTVLATAGGISPGAAVRILEVDTTDVVPAYPHPETGPAATQPIAADAFGRIAPHWVPPGKHRLLITTGLGGERTIPFTVGVASVLDPLLPVASETDLAAVQEVAEAAIPAAEKDVAGGVLGADEWAGFGIGGITDTAPVIDISRGRYGVSASGGDATAALVDAISRYAPVAQATGLTVLVPGDFRLSGPVVAPAWVNILGEGKRFASRFLCTTADAALEFQSRGGVSGRFTIDGGNVATQPFRHSGVKRAFEDLDVRQAVGDAIVIDNAQNCEHRSLMVDRVGGSCYVLRNGTSACDFYSCDGERAARYTVEQYQQAGTFLSPNPNYNTFRGGVWERPGNPDGTGSGLGAVLCTAGSLRLDDVVIGMVLAADSALISVGITAPGSYSRVAVAGCALTGITPANTVAFETRSANATLVLEGRNQVQGARALYRLADASIVDVMDAPSLLSVTSRFENYGGGTSTEDALVRTRRNAAVDVTRPASTNQIQTTRADGDAGYRTVETLERRYRGNGSTYTYTTYPSDPVGTGNPEGVVSARIGSVFTRMDGTNGQELYRKISGTGVSGWAPMAQQGMAVVATDANLTLTATTSPERLLHTGTLTANRTVTLSTTAVQLGSTFRVTRTGTGAFNLSVGGLKDLTTGTWCEVTHNGSAWVLTASGTV